MSGSLIGLIVGVAMMHDPLTFSGLVEADEVEPPAATVPSPEAVEAMKKAIDDERRANSPRSDRRIVSIIPDPFDPRRVGVESSVEARTRGPSTRGDDHGLNGEPDAHGASPHWSLLLSPRCD